MINCNNQSERMSEVFGELYSEDGKVLLKCPNLPRYQIREGCERVGDKAFVGCSLLKSLYVPYTFSDEAFDELMASDPTDNEIGNICHWNRPYVEEVYDDNEYWYNEGDVYTDEYGVSYANDGKRLLESGMGFSESEYRVPDGVLTICSNAFSWCKEYLILSVPRSIKVIGDNLFGEEGGRIEIRD